MRLPMLPWPRFAPWRRPPDRPGQQQEALKLLARAASLERTAGDTLRQLGDGAGGLAQTEPRARQQRRAEVRDEAVRWLTRVGLARARTVLLPAPSANQAAVLREEIAVLDRQKRLDEGQYLPWDIIVALSPDGSRLAVAYATATELWLVPTDGAAPPERPRGDVADPAG
jgi:hypothetical protein